MQVKSCFHRIDPAPVFPLQQIQFIFPYPTAHIQPASEAVQLTNKAVAEALDGLPAHKMHCSVLAEQAVRAAVRDYYDRSHIPYDPADFPVYEEE